MKRELKAKVVEKPSLSLPSKDHAIYWDQSLGRLGLMITGKGHKSWSVQYRAGSGVGQRPCKSLYTPNR